MENQSINTIKKPLPNASTVLVLGILSIALCVCYGLIGIVLGIIALVLAKKAEFFYSRSPELYTENSYKNMKAGRICAIVGLSISSLYFLIILAYLSFVGFALNNFFQIFEELGTTTI